MPRDSGWASDHCHARSDRRFAAVWGVFQDETPGGHDIEATGCLDEDVRSRLAPGHFAGGHDNIESPGQAEPVEVLLEPAWLLPGCETHWTARRLSGVEDFNDAGEEREGVDHGRDGSVQVRAEVVDRDLVARAVGDQLVPEMVHLRRPEQVAHALEGEREATWSECCDEAPRDRMLAVDDEAIEIEDHRSHGRDGIGGSEKRCHDQPRSEVPIRSDRLGNRRLCRGSTGHDSTVAWPEPHPDLDADERTTLTQHLDHFREGILVRLRSLTIEEAISYPLPGTNMRVGGIVRHLGAVEDRWFHFRLGGNDMPEPWASEREEHHPDGSMRVPDGCSIEDIATLYTEACDRSRTLTASLPSLDSKAPVPSFGKVPVTLRWVLVHLLVETSCHTGHVELLLDEIRRRRTS